MNKVCTKCGAEKPLEDFYADRRTSDGKRSDCRVCRLEYVRALDYGRRDPEHPTVFAEEKACSRCGVVQPRSEFHNNKNTFDAKVSQCKKCDFVIRAAYREKNRAVLKEKQRVYRKENPHITSAYDRKYRAENPEKVKAFSEKWRAANPEKVRMMGRRYKLTHPEAVRKNKENYKDRQKFFGAIAAIGAVNEKLGLK